MVWGSVANGLWRDETDTNPITVVNIVYACSSKNEDYEKKGLIHAIRSKELI